LGVAIPRRSLDGNLKRWGSKLGVASWGLESEYILKGKKRVLAGRQERVTMVEKTYIAFGSKRVTGNRFQIH